VRGVLLRRMRGQREPVRRAGQLHLHLPLVRWHVICVANRCGSSAASEEVSAAIAPEEIPNIPLTKVLIIIYHSISLPMYYCSHLSMG
jgi:hypothetical protein